MTQKCFDDRTHVWYPSHEWADGSCVRCGKNQPGVSDQDRAEMQAQTEERLTAHLRPHYSQRSRQNPAALHGTVSDIPSTWTPVMVKRIGNRVQIKMRGR